MPYRIAIQPDDYTRPKTATPRDAWSPRWAARLEAAGHEVRWVDVYRADILEQLRGCDGLLWRHGHFGGMQQIARRLMPVVQRELGLAVFPDQNTAWHYDDKIAQRYLLEAAGIPAPKTWVWFDAAAARHWAQAADYPLVLKLSSGAGSTNVRLVRSAGEAREWIDRLFALGVYDLGDASFPRLGWPKRLKAAAKAVLRGWPPRRAAVHTRPHGGYALFQEFLAGNAFDTRVTAVGRRAFAFRRFNRPDDFRASGSGRIDHDPQAIDPRLVRLAFRTAARLGSQSCAIDGLMRDGEPVVGEVSFTYLSAAVHACPGHWELQGDAESDALGWVEGPTWPEDAILDDFLARLDARPKAHGQ